jgi:hypothetical protein
MTTKKNVLCKSLMLKESIKSEMVGASCACQSKRMYLHENLIKNEASKSQETL